MLADVGKLTTRRGAPVALKTDLDGQSADVDSNITLEAAPFPHVVPIWEGMVATQHGFQSIPQIANATNVQSFSLHKSYVLLMGMMRQAKVVANSVSKVKLIKDMTMYRHTHPDASEDDVWNNTLKHSIPQGMYDAAFILFCCLNKCVNGH